MGERGATLAEYALVMGVVALGAVASVRALGDQKIRGIWAGSVSARDGLNEYTRLAQQTLDEALRF